MTPPQLPRRLLHWLLPGDVREVLVGDLDEEFERHVAPSRSRLSARAWYWRQALRSVPGAFRLRRQARGRAGGPRGPRIQWLVEQILGDVRYGVRRAIRSPSLLATVTLTLALGIAAATSVFALTRVVLLRPLPYASSDRLVHISEVDSRRLLSSGTVSHVDFRDYRAQNSTLVDVCAFDGGSRMVTGIGQPDRVPMAEVTEGFFDLLGVRPALGRDFDAADVHPQSPPVVIITDGAWRRRFGADPLVVGQTIGLSGQQTTIVGVLPRDFEFPLRGLAELWLPLRSAEVQPQRRYPHSIDIIGRLRPGVSVAQATADLDVIARRFASIDPQDHPATRTAIVSLSDKVVGSVRPILLVLLGAAVFVLIVACANIAGLLVGRGAARLHEIEIRSAIGASRGRLIGQLLTESLVLAIPGGVLGLLLGQYAVRLFVLSIPRAQRAALPHLASFSIDSLTVIVSLALVAVSMIAFGILPAWQAARHGDRTTLHGRGTADVRRLRLQSLFVVAQLALAVVLLSGSGLMGRSVHRLLTTSPGFVTDGLLTARVNPSFFDAPAVSAYHQRLIERIGAIPGILGVATVNQLPLSGPGNNGTFAIAGSSPAGGGLTGPAKESTTAVRTVSPEYFAVMSIPLQQGRALSVEDRRGRPPVVLVNETFAASVFAGRPLGHRIVFPFLDGRPTWEIVGVVGDEQIASLDRDAMVPVVYFPFGQVLTGDINLVARTSGDPEMYIHSIRAAAMAVDPNVPVYAAESMNRMIADSAAVFRRRSVLMLVGGFAVAAVLLAAIGLYGVLAQTVSHRTREIGVRMALGARRGHVARSILGRALAPAAAGLGIGMAVALVLTPALDTLLFQVPSRDWVTLGLVLGFLAIVAVVACIVPARRAVRIDPVVALRQL
ncbi:MAG TPA: ADOP family duplicated permease [Vicinamibacterales bacterium]|nr:ADOP family duplicated permease [Vicinamibacterales bacterium]